jgi:hypothetical protein
MAMLPMITHGSDAHDAHDDRGGDGHADGGGDWSRDT